MSQFPGDGSNNQTAEQQIFGSGQSIHPQDEKPRSSLLGRLNLEQANPDDARDEHEPPSRRLKVPLVERENRNQIIADIWKFLVTHGIAAVLPKSALQSLARMFTKGVAELEITSWLDSNKAYIMDLSHELYSATQNLLLVSWGGVKFKRDEGKETKVYFTETVDPENDFELGDYLDSISKGNFEQKTGAQPIHSFVVYDGSTQNWNRFLMWVLVGLIVLVLGIAVAIFVST